MGLESKEDPPMADGLGSAVVTSAPAESPLESKAPGHIGGQHQLQLLHQRLWAVRSLGGGHENTTWSQGAGGNQGLEPHEAWVLMAFRWF